MFRLKAFRLRMIAAAAFAAALCHGGAARAQDCPGHPDALGTSRVLAVDAGAYSRVGTMQYKQTLPLADKEVAITFDDGPLPPYSNEILDILDAQCVKATFFIVGDMAKAFPDVVRREYAAGHTIGTHSASHPLHFDKLLGDRLDEQIDGGIAAVSAALGDPAAVAPFFRIPGLRRSETVEDALAARGLVVFGADAVADDWHHRLTPAQIIERAMTRLEKHGRGILLLHDIHARARWRRCRACCGSSRSAVSAWCRWCRARRAWRQTRSLPARRPRSNGRNPVASSPLPMRCYRLRIPKALRRTTAKTPARPSAQSPPPIGRS